MGPFIRLATAKDQEALVLLYRDLNPGEVKAEPRVFAAIYKEILSSRYFHLVVAEQGKLLVGTCYLNIIPNLSRSASPYAVLENVVVASQVRRQGVGKAIVAFALALAWERGCYKVMLQTGSKKEATHRFYRSCGFSPNEKFAFVARPPACGG